jgi:hypothetical protein
LFKFLVKGAYVGKFMAVPNLFEIWEKFLKEGGEKAL